MKNADGHVTAATVTAAGFFSRGSTRWRPRIQIDRNCTNLGGAKHMEIHSLVLSNGSQVEDVFRELTPLKIHVAPVSSRDAGHTLKRSEPSSSNFNMVVRCCIAEWGCWKMCSFVGCATSWYAPPVDLQLHPSTIDQTPSWVESRTAFVKTRSTGTLTEVITLHWNHHRWMAWAPNHEIRLPPLLCARWTGTCRRWPLWSLGTRKRPGRGGPGRGGPGTAGLKWNDEWMNRLLYWVFLVCPMPNTNGINGYMIWHEI